MKSEPLIKDRKKLVINLEIYNRKHHKLVTLTLVLRLDWNLTKAYIPFRHVLPAVMT